MRRRRRHRSLQAAPPGGGLQELIPAGPVNPHRGRRGEIETEARKVHPNGTILQAGQYVSTPVKRMLNQGLITQNEANAAQLFLRDYESAYANCVNALAAVQVDSRGGGTGVLEQRLSSGVRFQRARAYLRKRLADIAAAGILNDPEAGIDFTFTGIGSSLRPDLPARLQQEIGKTILVIICQELADFYARPRRNVTRGVNNVIPA